MVGNRRANLGLHMALDNGPRRSAILLTPDNGDRGAIGQIGESLHHLNDPAVDPHAQQSHAMALLNAQAEAIQGLTLLVLKGQQVQTQLIQAMDAQPRTAAPNGMPKWAYYAMGVMMVWSCLTMIFSTIF